MNVPTSRSIAPPVDANTATSAAPSATRESLVPCSDKLQRICKPSALYAAGLWQLALAIAGHSPRLMTGMAARALCTAYAFTVRTRRQIVYQNLLPVLDGNSVSASRASWQLFREFGQKLTDLWRYESGKPVAKLFHTLTGWEHFVAAHQKGRGILLLTVHLGNWEFGAPLLTERGFNLQVITLAEPEARLTEIRLRCRQRWGVETLALSDDPFASLEIIHSLTRNNTVALLMDRPPIRSAVPVKLFGQKFMASVSAAELARASGCSLLPVVLPRNGSGYSAHLLPEIPYERRELGSRPARAQLTQEILNGFAPFIRQYPEQWYHFVPIWPR